MSLETTILQNLVFNEDYTRKVIPFVKDEYFSEQSERVVFKLVQDFIGKYNELPTIDSLKISLSDTNIVEGVYTDTVSLIDKLKDEKINNQWLIDETETFCRDKAVYNAIFQSINILDGKDKNHSKDGIPSLLQDALGVSFDKAVGHDYFDDAEARFDFYHRKEERIPFDLDLFNKITKGGIPDKTLNIALAGTGVGKSMFMCHMAANCLGVGKNVLYITLEMAEERIAERIDANLLDISMDEIADIPKSSFKNRIEKINSKTHGKLIIKEYPTASAHVGHFKSLLNELALKKTFVPDIIFIDYLNICASSRFKPGGGVNSYTFVKSIAEELRGLAVEHAVPVFSATQTTRSGFSNTDVELTDTSESFGLPATADFMFALIATEELEQLNQIMVKQLKNRYNDPSYYKRFVVGVDRAKMRLYDVENDAQRDITDSGINVDADDLDKYDLNSMFKSNRDFSAIKI